MEYARPFCLVVHVLRIFALFSFYCSLFYCSLFFVLCSLFFVLCCSWLLLCRIDNRLYVLSLICTPMRILTSSIVSPSFFVFRYSFFVFIF